MECINILEEDFGKYGLDNISDFSNINWSSDWNGDEVGYDDVDVVGLYSLKRFEGLYFYIDVSTMEVLEAWIETEENK